MLAEAVFCLPVLRVMHQTDSCNYSGYSNKSLQIKWINY